MLKRLNASPSTELCYTTHDPTDPKTMIVDTDSWRTISRPLHEIIPDGKKDQKAPVPMVVLASGQGCV